MWVFTLFNLMSGSLVWKPTCVGGIERYSIILRVERWVFDKIPFAHQILWGDRLGFTQASVVETEWRIVPPLPAQYKKTAQKAVFILKSYFSFSYFRMILYFRRAFPNYEKEI